MLKNAKCQQLNCVHFNVYEQDKFCAMKKSFYNLGAWVETV